MLRPMLFLLGLTALGEVPDPVPDPVVHLPASRVSEAFLRGSVLVVAEGYEVHASRRDAPGRGEVHVDHVDVIHVLSGTATFVTGGRLTHPEALSAVEVRGAGIEGGDERELRPGDVVVVPKGTPHWFKRVDGPFTYYVVKVG